MSEAQLIKALQENTKAGQDLKVSTRKLRYATILQSTIIVGGTISFVLLLIWGLVKWFEWVG